MQLYSTCTGNHIYEVKVTNITEIKREAKVTVLLTLKNKTSWLLWAEFLKDEKLFLAALNFLH